MFNQWCTIESDPGVFTELVKKTGAPSVQVEELYSMDDDYLVKNIKPKIYGFIFLFKWTKNLEKKPTLKVYDQNLFFARQIVNNACATQAIISILLNAPIKIQNHLKDFYDFTKDLSCQDRGLALSNSDAIRVIHNSFKRPEPFIFKDDNKKRKKEPDVYHFVSYVPHKGKLYELDGLQDGPIMLGSYQNEQQWMEIVKKQIQSRILSYSQKQIRFNLMMVCQDLTLKTHQDITTLLQRKASLHHTLKDLGKDYNKQIVQKYPDSIISEEKDTQTINLQLEQLEIQLTNKQHFLLEQKQLAEKRKQQNQRRKHDYVPLIIQMIKIMAKKGQLTELVEKAKKKG